MAEISTNKRRRKEGLQLSDLPDNAVAHVASYLSNISRAIFAIASPSGSRSTILSDAKLWETLDFGDIDWSLARRLKDDGLEDILTITDAVHNAKCIKLTGCTKIFGTGLSPLRGSIVLKQLDLGLVGQHNSPNLRPQPWISVNIVVPILTSIINEEGNTLMHLTLPKKWRDNRQEGTLSAFLRSYNEVLVSRTIKCTKCNLSISDVESFQGHLYHDPGVEWYAPWYGLTNDLCCKCLKYYCNSCEIEDGEQCLNYCVSCERDYCQLCVPTHRCGLCAECYCNGCVDGLPACEECDMAFCKDCEPDVKCACVNKVLCGGCAEDSTHSCKWEGCEEVYCSNCEDDHLLSHRTFNCD